MRVMVIGASNDRSKFGNKAVRAYTRLGHEVVPINPREHTIEGLPVHARVADPAGPFDRALVYLPPEVGESVMSELAARRDIAEVWLNPGADGPRVVAEAERLGLNVVQACAIVDLGTEP